MYADKVTFIIMKSIAIFLLEEQYCATAFNGNKTIPFFGSHEFRVYSGNLSSKIVISVHSSTPWRQGGNYQRVT